MLFDLQFQVAARDEDRAGNVALDELLALAYIHEGQRPAVVQPFFQLAGVDLADLALGELHQLVAVQSRHECYSCAGVLRAACCPLPVPTAAGHRGDDRDLVVGVQGRMHALEAAHLIVVHEDVDEALDIAVVVQQPVRHARILVVDRLDQRAHVLTFHF